MIENKAEKRSKCFASDIQPILELAGSIAHQLGCDRALLVSFPYNADEVCRSGALCQGDILHGPASDLGQAARPGQSWPIPGIGFTVVLKTLFHKLVELGNRNIPAGFDADCTAAVGS